MAAPDSEPGLGDNEAWRAAALEHYCAGRVQQAEAICRAMFAAHPTRHDLGKLLGLLCLKQGKADEAVSIFEALAAAGAAEAYMDLGLALEESARAGARNAAIAAYKKAAELQPNHAEAYFRIGLNLKSLGRLDDAIQSLSKALDSDPGHAQALVCCGETLLLQKKREAARNIAISLARLATAAGFPNYSAGCFLASCGLVDEARRCFVACLGAESDVADEAYMQLAALGFVPVPERVPQRLLASRYDLKARRYDHMVDSGRAAGRPYRAPALVLQALRKMHPGRTDLDMLDLGCGTGQVGLLVRPIARTLDGVDLSRISLDKATEKNIYDNLAHADLVAFMATRPQQYDAVTACGTLIHFNDLLPVFDAARSTIRANGTFAFTCFPDAVEPELGARAKVRSRLDLLKNGCFPHSRADIARAAVTAGFAVEYIEEDVHEYTGNAITGLEAICGLVVGLRRHANG